MRPAREIILTDILPGALQIGLPYASFLNMTPRVIVAHVKAYEESERRRLNERYADAWLNGQYVLQAIASAFGKGNQYPSEPYRELTQEEQKKQLIDFLNGFKIKHKKE